MPDCRPSVYPVCPPAGRAGKEGWMRAGACSGDWLGGAHCCCISVLTGRELAAGSVGFS